MSKIEAVFTDKAPKPLPQFSQAVKFNGMVYCSGNIGMDPDTSKLVEGTVKERTRQALKNLQAVLEEAGSSLHNVLKVNVFITTMDNFATMNEAYDEFFIWDQKPCRTCVAVKQLPFDTDVEIECTASCLLHSPELVEPVRDEMIPNRLRILRTSIRVHPTDWPTRTASPILAPRRHVQPCLAPRAPHAPRLLSTTSSLSSQSSPSRALGRQDESPSTLSPTAANPPETTRPPPLELPVRGPDTSTFSHLFSTGKAYLTFYKTGLKNIYLNTRLVWSLNAASGIPRSNAPPMLDSKPNSSSPSSSSNNNNNRNKSPSPPSPVRAVGSTTRSTFLLRRRWSHDVRRLPLFAAVLLVCGEFTPLIVLALPSVVPLTCRIPRQVEAIHRKTEERRTASFARLGGDRSSSSAAAAPAPAPAPPTLITLTRAQAVAHMARSLNLISPLWDRLPLPDSAVALIARRKVRQHLAFLEEDNALLRQAGGAGALEPDEVVLACADRATRHLGVALPQLRETLERALDLTAPAGAVGLSEKGNGLPTWAVIAQTLVEKKMAHHRQTLLDRAALNYEEWEKKL